MCSAGAAPVHSAGAGRCRGLLLALLAERSVSSKWSGNVSAVGATMSGNLMCVNQRLSVVKICACCSTKAPDDFLNETDKDRAIFFRAPWSGQETLPKNTDIHIQWHAYKSGGAGQDKDRASSACERGQCVRICERSASTDMCRSAHHTHKQQACCHHSTMPQ